MGGGGKERILEELIQVIIYHSINLKNFRIRIGAAPHGEVKFTLQGYVRCTNPVVGAASATAGIRARDEASIGLLTIGISKSPTLTVTIGIIGPPAFELIIESGYGEGPLTRIA